MMPVYTTLHQSRVMQQLGTYCFSVAAQLRLSSPRPLVI